MRPEAAREPSVELHLSTDTDPPSLRIAGTMDAFTTRPIETQLLLVIEQYPRLEFDLSEIRVLTSDALTVLERCYDHATRVGSQLSIVASQGSLTERVLTYIQHPVDEASDPANSTATPYR